jgi:hypothetical protein
MAEYTITSQGREIAARVEKFVREVIVPFERDQRWTPHGPNPEMAREVRAFRIYDGPTEVHLWSLAKRIKKETLGRLQVSGASDSASDPGPDR